MAYDIVLHPTVLSTFGITQIHKHISSGQRQVYIVEAQGKTAVIKIMSTIAADRLSRELDVYKRFAGKPGLPVLIDIKAIEGKIVLLEEYIPGHNLQEVASKYTNDESKVKDLLKSIITIMLPIWEANLVHRDIKPENIIIKPDDAPVLIDFGIVKDFNSDSVTEAGSQPFSPLYGAPEQYAGQKEYISHRTDLFSIGVLGYRLFYDMLPFGNTKVAIEQRFQQTSKPLILPENCPISDFLTACLHIPSSERPRRPTSLLSLLS